MLFILSCRGGKLKKCLNCKWDVRDTDIYCRNCGCPLQSNGKYIFVNVIIVFVVLGILGMIALFIASYLI